MRAAIFDFDGVIVDSEPLHYEALRLALQPEGIDLGEEEYGRFYLAYDDREGARIALDRHGMPYDASRVEAVARRKAAAFEALIPSVPYFPGAKELVRSLAAEVPVAIASGALRGEIEAILAAGGLRDAFAAIVGAEDVSRGKPDPEPYLTALSRLAPLVAGISAEECLVFEDSMAGIAAARAAGMRVVAVTTSYPASRLTAAHQVVESLDQLRPSDLRALFSPSPA
jgi:beta-phosphoglucomutase-like phosphatase (HAD superfamily)